MLQKAKRGLYPSSAPAGYRNVEGPDQKRIIVPNGDAPTIARLFEEFATGQYSLKELAAKARADGWNVGGHPLHRSTLHQILLKRIYTGDFNWNDVTYTGTHEAHVSRHTWERVQMLFDHRMHTKKHSVNARSSMISHSPASFQCGHCGCNLVSGLKKQRYVYYHCTGRGKCPEPYTREEATQDQFAASLRELLIPAGIVTWLQEATTFVLSGL